MISEENIIKTVSEEYKDITEELKLEMKPVIAFLIKDNSQNSNHPSILFYGEYGIFMAILDNDDMNNIIALRKIKFNKIKGLQIKNKKEAKIDILTDLGGHFKLSVPLSEKVKGYPNFQSNRAYFLEKLADYENGETKSHIIKIEQKDIKQKIMYFVPLIAIVSIFIKFSTEMGKLEFFIKLIGVVLLYGILFSIIKAGITAFKDRAFAKEFHLIMEEFDKNKDKYKLYNGLKNISRKPLSIGNSNTYLICFAAVAYSIGNTKETKDLLSKVVFDDAYLKENEKEEYLRLKEELENNLKN